MSSAEGAVQQYSYEATFPLLLNVSDQPTYFMALKDSAGLVKMYAIVNVQQYQIVAIGTTVTQCQQNYKELLIENNILKSDEVSELLDTAADESEAQTEYKKVTSRISEIRSANIDGNTIYYIKLDGGDVYYTVSAKDFPEAVILNEGDKVTIRYIPEDGAQILEGGLAE